MWALVPDPSVLSTAAFQEYITGNTIVNLLGMMSQSPTRKHIHLVTTLVIFY